jgi:hypothetical protein
MVLQAYAKVRHRGKPVRVGWTASIAVSPQMVWGVDATVMARSEVLKRYEYFKQVH